MFKFEARFDMLTFAKCVQFGQKDSNLKRKFGNLNPFYNIHQAHQLYNSKI